MITERESGSSLFERIREAAITPSQQRSKAALLRSVRETLRNVLNTRSGSCYGSPELGIDDFNDQSPDSMNIRDWMVQAIRECILGYEPRISDVSVAAVAEDASMPLELRFHIVATIDFSNSRDVLEFDILLDNHRQWRVE
nr:type VI secretion system baseplate subunit TssE [Lelliottia aquatilis]